MSSQSTVRLLILAAFLAIAAWALLRIPTAQERAQAKIGSFEDCVAAGNAVMESYPAQCRTSDGRLFVQQVPPQQPDGTAVQKCITAGCSKELCVEESAGDQVSICIYKAEYACYKNATCERQQNGQCGWTQTEALQSCLKNPPPLDQNAEPLPQ